MKALLVDADSVSRTPRKVSLERLAATNDAEPRRTACRSLRRSLPLLGTIAAAGAIAAAVLTTKRFAASPLLGPDAELPFSCSLD